jgi:hypothetical protein
LPLWLRPVYVHDLSWPEIPSPLSASSVLSHLPHSGTSA